jgi:isopentenyldiphosphate isomerase
MTRFYGNVGYAVTKETAPGVWTETIEGHPYYGDVTRNTKRTVTSTSINDAISVNNLISIVGDPFAYENFFSIKYVEWMNSKWKVTNVEVQYPRLILTIGELYHASEN